MNEKPDNVEFFPGPLHKDEALAYSRPMDRGVMLILTDDVNISGSVKFTIIGEPDSKELLWMAEQLRLRALYDNESIDYVEDDGA